MKEIIRKAFPFGKVCRESFLTLTAMFQPLRERATTRLANPPG